MSEKAATQFELSQPPSDAISAVRFAPDSPTRLVVSSWDKYVYLYDTHVEKTEDGKLPAVGGTLLKKFEHRAPVLDVCFGADDNEIFSAGMDWDVKRINLETDEETVLSSHSAPVKAVSYCREHSLLISASWSCTLHLHDLKTSDKPPFKISLPQRPYSIALSPTKLVVAMSARLFQIYELKTLIENAETPDDIEPWQHRESSLKYMTRAVACMPNNAGYASSSIEGRIAVEWFDPSAASQARKYAFKCHRQPSIELEGTDLVYPVNALTFHPIHGTFASGGGDGVVALWDGVTKRRIRAYQKYSQSVAALGFAKDGKSLAVGVCPGFEDGKQDYVAEGFVKVYIRHLSETEAKGKGPK